MKDKMKRRVQMRHEISDHGKVDRLVQKSMMIEKSRVKPPNTKRFVDSLLALWNSFLGFFIKSKPSIQKQIAKKSITIIPNRGCFGGSIKKKYYSNKGRPGVKLAKKLTVHIPSKGII